MVDAFDPYAPPRGEVATSPLPAEDGAIPEGAYTLESEDVAAAMRARMGVGRWVWLGCGAAMLVIPLATNGFDLARVRWISYALTTMAVVFFFIPRLAGRRIHRLDPPRRSVRMTLDPAALVVRDGAGNESRITWPTFVARRKDAARIYLEVASQLQYVLPRRAWPSDAAFAAVESFVATRVPAAKSRAPRVLLLWVALIVLFLLIWWFLA